MYHSMTLYLILVSVFCDGFFLGSYRKQPDCGHRAPHAAPWHPSPTTTSGSFSTTATNLNKSNSNNYNNNNNNNNPNAGVNIGQQAYGTYKDYGSYHQQPQTAQPQPQPTQQVQQPTQQIQQQPQKQQQTQSHAQPTQAHPKVYTTQHQTAVQYEPTAYNQVYNQQPSSLEGAYGSYPQNVQLVPCLCPVNKEILEQQQFQQQQTQPQFLYGQPAYAGESDVSSQTNSKKNT